MQPPLPKNGPPLVEDLLASLIVQQAQTNRLLAMLCARLGDVDELKPAEANLQESLQWLQSIRGQ